MADEEKTTPQEKESVQVTDTDLSSEWDKAQTGETEVTETKPEQTPEETEEPEQTEQETKTEIPEEPVDNAERSKLGRRLKSTEDALKQVLDEIKSLKTPVQAPVTEVSYDDKFVESQVAAAVQRGEIPETIITPQDQIKVNNFYKGLQDYMSNQYASKYLGMLKTPSLKGDTPDEIHAEVVAELQRVESPFNLNRFNNPTLDAQMNYKEALNSILMKRISEGKPTNVFKGKAKDTPPTGTSVTTRTSAVKNELPSLDESSMDFIKRTGMTVESVKSALGSDLPLHLKGKY